MLFLRSRQSLRIICPVILASLLVAGCGGVDVADRSPTTTGGTYKVGNPYQIGGITYFPAEDPDYDEIGIASWYGVEFHGKPTANGDTYDMNALTAAHKTLPMPFDVRVTNLENNRSIVLTVNDRGPFVDGRIIDVSRRAAQLLGFYEAGTVRVRVQAADLAIASLADYSDIIETGDRYIQVGSYQERANAEAAGRKVMQAGNMRIERELLDDGRVVYRVRLGPFDDEQGTRRALDHVAYLGFPGAIVVHQQ